MLTADCSQQFSSAGPILLPTKCPIVQGRSPLVCLNVLLPCNVILGLVIIRLFQQREVNLRLSQDVQVCVKGKAQVGQQSLQIKLNRFDYPSYVVRKKSTTNVNMEPQTQQLTVCRTMREALEMIPFKLQQLQNLMET